MNAPPARFHRTRFILRGAALSIALGLVCLDARLWAETGGPCIAQPRPQDEVWLVSNRGLGCNLEHEVRNLHYWHYDRQRSWVPATLAELLATDDPGVITTIFIHGNRISAGEAFTKGWGVYRTLVQQADERPVRFIIWSWPSEAIRGPLRDGREKAYRTIAAGYYLASLIDQFRPEVPLSLFGHSFGARVATGALQLLGGGAVDGHRLVERSHTERSLMQVVLVAAALDSNWLCSGHCQGLALGQTSRMLLLNNGCDMLLKRYRLLYGDRGRQQALGYTGLAEWCLAPGDRGKVAQIDACCQVGKRHALDGYLGAPNLMSMARACLLFEDGTAPPVAPQEVIPAPGPGDDASRP